MGQKQYRPWLFAVKLRRLMWKLVSILVCFLACLLHKTIIVCFLHLSLEKRRKEENNNILYMPNREQQWRWLWRLKIPQRCKIFLWLALNDRLPSNASKAASHISDSAPSTCPFCHAQETLLHVLRDCPRAASVWVHLVATHHQHGFFSCPLWDWMVTYLLQPWSSVNYSIDVDKDGVLFAATVWFLWKDRKTWVHDGPGFSSERLIQHVGTLADDYGRVLLVEHCAPNPAVRYVSLCFYWNQPASQLQLRKVADTSQVVFPKL